MIRLQSNTHTATSRRKPAKRAGARGRKRGNKSQPPLGKIAALAAITIVPMIGGGLVMAKYMGEEQMQANFCFTRPDQAVHAVYVDASHTKDMSERQLRDYERIFENIYDAATANTRIDVYTSGRDHVGSVAKPVASLCKPAQRVSELEHLDAPAKTAPYVARLADEGREAYSEMVTHLLADLQNADKTALDSAILSDLRGISRYSGFQGANRELTVLTDGLENSAETARFCFVRGDLPTFSTFKSQDRYSFVAPDSFEGVKVNLMLVETVTLPHPEAPYCTNAEIRSFWTNYFTGNGAANVRLDYLRHGVE